MIATAWTRESRSSKEKTGIEARQSSHVIRVESGALALYGEVAGQGRSNRSELVAVVDPLVRGIIGAERIRIGSTNLGRRAGKDLHREHGDHRAEEFRDGWEEERGDGRARRLDRRHREGVGFVVDDEDRCAEDLQGADDVGRSFGGRARGHQDHGGVAGLQRLNSTVEEVLELESLRDEVRGFLDLESALAGGLDVRTRSG